MILVTGAAGFIGREVCRQLVTAGQKVLAVDKNAAQARQKQNLSDIGITELVTDDLLRVDLQAILGRTSGVIHLAGSPGVQTSWSSGFGTHLDNNVLTTQRLAEALLDAPGQRMVVASSSSVYGNITTPSADEAHPLAPLSPYGASKAAMEHVIRAYAHRGIDIIALRYFTVYGPHQRPDMAMNLMIEALKGNTRFRVRGDGEQVRNFTFVADAARATIQALMCSDKNIVSGQAINIGGAETVSLNGVLATMEQLAGRPVPVERVARVPGDPQRTAANIDLAATLLGWRPVVSLQDGLRAQLDWQMDRTPRTIDTTKAAAQMPSPTAGVDPKASPSGVSADTHR